MLCRESAVHDDVSIDGQPSVPGRETRLPEQNRLKEENNLITIPSSRGIYTVIRPKQSPEVYKVKKVYVGLLKELPPPTAVRDGWEHDVRPKLEVHLSQATSMLPKSLRDEEIITEAVLCMTGKKCSPASMPPGSACLKHPIALRPTVWIYCGSKKCKERVVGAIRRLTYLKHFIDKFCMESPLVTLHAPWPAAFIQAPTHDAPENEEGITSISFAIQRGALGGETVCGANTRFTIQASNNIVERCSKVGGMVVAANSLYGLTSAHALVNQVLEPLNSNWNHPVDTLYDTSSDESPADESSSGDESESDIGNPYPSSIRRKLTDPAVTRDRLIQEYTDVDWIECEPPKVIAYVGRGTIIEDYSFPTPAPDTSDFALIQLAPIPILGNAFYDPFTQALADVLEFLPKSDLRPGEVWIISDYRSPLLGYLLEGDASMILRGTVMRTKKIQISFPGGMLTDPFSTHS